jgi:hypothetical protein
MPACRRLDGAAWGADHITFAQVSQVMKSFLVICSDKKLAHVPVFLPKSFCVQKLLLSLQAE